MTGTIAIEKLDILKDEIVDRLNGAVNTLRTMASDNLASLETQERLTRKADGVQAVLDAQSERLVNVSSVENAYIITEFIRIEAEDKNTDVKAGMMLARGYVLEYLYVAAHTS